MVGKSLVKNQTKEKIEKDEKNLLIKNYQKGQKQKKTKKQEK